MVLLLAILVLGLAVYIISEVVTYPAQRQRRSLDRAAGYGRTRESGRAVERARFRERVIAPAVKRLAAAALRLHPKLSIETIGARLLAAGVSARISATQFLALKAGLAIGGLVLALLFGIASSPSRALLFAPLLGGLGFLLPDATLKAKTRARRDRIRAELPDALDLLAVSVEAGLGFDGAVTKLSENMEGALVDEFALTLSEIRIGESRHDALKRMTERAPVPELGAFVRSVIQADQLGISLGRILRVQAADSRLRRQAAAEERAMKAPIKMLFPTVVLIFPAMFLVILGPALLNLTSYFK